MNLFLAPALLLASSTGIAWEEVAETPRGYVPQGMVAVGGELFLSAYRGDDECSAVFALRRCGDGFTFEKAFAMPPEARHTGGLASVPGRPDLLFATDYHSNKVYLLDLASSRRTGRARVLASSPSGLNKASACCVVRLCGGRHVLLVTEFRLLRRGRNAFFDWSADGTAASITPAKDVPTYRNLGYSQGVKWREGFVYESGNRPLRASYLSRYPLGPAMRDGRARRTQAETRPGPGRYIEDFEFFGGYIWCTDEGTDKLYRTPNPFDKSRSTGDHNNPIRPHPGM